MIIISLSDLHLGKGKFFKNGHINILEDFFEDERFYEFAEYYSSGKFYWQDVNLVLNGDILNLIQIDVDGVFNHIIDEEVTIEAIKSIHKGHPQFFNGLKKFLSSPNKKITYIIGNHDNGMAFTKAQQFFRSIVGADVEFAFTKEIHGVYIEHGHQYEAINTVPKSQYFVSGPNGKDILNLPWGSLFCLTILPRLKKTRPLIDKVRPMNSYIKWCFFHDFTFFLKMSRMIMTYFFQSNFDIYTKQNRNFKTTVNVLKQITIYPRYAKKAKNILKRNRNIHTVIMGHTHVQEWRKFPEEKYYFNTGTWNMIPSIDAALHESVSSLTYCYVEVHPKTNTLQNASLNIWQGKWRPFREEIKAFI
jgi:UDP-2,3-diacylglucosamine pyrophosphatase LpxH